VVTVRKDKDSERWYVGAITDGEARDIELSLDFLDAEREYEAIIYRDGERAGWDSYPTDYVVERRNVTSADVLNLRMAPGGGFAIELR
jgi:alpha-glucosidase